MLILGIETSCDETAIALIETQMIDHVFECRILASQIHSQADLHSPYGGVFPTLAKREHEKRLRPMLDKILKSQTTHDHLKTSENKIISLIDAIAVTEGPGLEPALWTGIVFAEELGKEWGKPVIPVNHMEGHIVGSLLESDTADGQWKKLKELPLPSLALLISGGHTEMVIIKSHQAIGNSIDISSSTQDSYIWQPIFDSAGVNTNSLHYSIIGSTRDDAVGEAFDKVARLLGLPYPGGPHISKLADEARKENITSTVKLPRPMIYSKDLDFSFSGLKTAVLYAVESAKKSGIFDDKFKNGIAREFEDAITETLDTKLRSALDETGARSLIIGGGVSANTILRKSFTRTTSEYNIPLYLPTKHISGDNALMIALAGALNFQPSEKLRAHGTKKLGVQI